jgi:hypothetical protein
MGLAYLLTPKHAANGFFFDDDQLKIIGSAVIFASKTIQPVSADRVKEEMISYCTQMTTLSQQEAEIVFSMNMKSFWNVIGRKKFPALFEVAKPISEMICSSATSERTWSTFRFIHSRLRNRLTNDRVEKLVFLYINSVLLDDKD